MRQRMIDFKAFMFCEFFANITNFTPFFIINCLKKSYF